MSTKSDTQSKQDVFDVENLIGRRSNKRWNRTSMGDIFERLCWSYPDKEAVIGGSDAYGSAKFARLTYRQADVLANQVAQALLARGVSRGDRILFFCENSVEAYVAKIGVAKAGAVCAPINPRMAPDVQDYLITLLGGKFAFVDAELWPAAADMFTKRGVTGAMIPIGGNNLPSGWISFEQFVDGMPTVEPDVEINGDDIWELLPTSGTTSMPKYVMMSHNFTYLVSYSFALTHSRGLRFESDLRVCSVLPIVFHAPDQSQSYPAFLCGGTVIIGRRVTAENFAGLVSRERATHLWAGGPKYLDDMVDVIKANPARYDISSLTSICWAWGSLRPSTADELKRLCAQNVSLVEILGQSDAMPSTRFPLDKWPEIYRATAPDINITGLPSPLLAASIMDEYGNLIEPSRAGVPGEIVYRSPGVTAGYYKNEKATREAFRYGWFHSGDCCMFDKNGLFVSVDRIKDVVKSGGETVSSRRVEDVLITHPAVQKVAVVGLPHPRWIEAVTAAVILRPEQSVTEEELLAFCRARLAGFETPKAFIFVEAFPEAVGGKVRKYLLREQYCDFYKDVR